MFKSTVADNFNYAYHLANLAKRPKMAIRKSSSVVKNQLPYSNKISPRLTEFGPLPWQAKQTVSALCQLQPATYLGGPNSVNPGQILLVYGIVVQNENIKAAGRRKDLLSGGPKK